MKGLIFEIFDESRHYAIFNFSRLDYRGRGTGYSSDDMFPLEEDLERRNRRRRQDSERTMNTGRDAGTLEDIRARGSTSGVNFAKISIYS